MNKKELIKYLHEKVGFVWSVKDEDVQGNLIITKQGFKTLNEIKKELKKQIKSYKTIIDNLTKDLKRQKNIVVVHNFKGLLQDKIIKIDGHLIFLNPTHTNISRCSFQSTGLILNPKVK